MSTRVSSLLATHLRSLPYGKQLASQWKEGKEKWQISQMRNPLNGRYSIPLSFARKKTVCQADRYPRKRANDRSTWRVEFGSCPVTEEELLCWPSADDNDITAQEYSFYIHEHESSYVYIAGNQSKDIAFVLFAPRKSTTRTVWTDIFFLFLLLRRRYL